MISSREGASAVTVSLSVRSFVWISPVKPNACVFSDISRASTSGSWADVPLYKAV